MVVDIPGDPRGWPCGRWCPGSRGPGRRVPVVGDSITPLATRRLLDVLAPRSQVHVSKASSFTFAQQVPHLERLLGRPAGRPDDVVELGTDDVLGANPWRRTGMHQLFLASPRGGLHGGGGRAWSVLQRPRCGTGRCGPGDLGGPASGCAPGRLAQDAAAGRPRGELAGHRSPASRPRGRPPTGRPPPPGSRCLRRGRGSSSPRAGLSR
jgi:hypothetical protein